MMGYKKKATIPKICRDCGTSFLARDSKVFRCPECKAPKLCECGCGLFANSECRFISNHHIKKGMKKHPNSGFKFGSENVAKRPEVRKKISEAIRGRCCTFIGKTKEEIILLREEMTFRLFKGKKRRSDGFRSILEAQLANELQHRSISYQYEPLYRFWDGCRFFPDFVVDGVIVEVSGFAYKQWQNQFLQKIFKQVCSGYKVVVVTYPEHVDTIRDAVNFPTFSVDHLQEIHPVIGIDFFTILQYEHEVWHEQNSSITVS